VRGQFVVLVVLETRQNKSRNGAERNDGGLAVIVPEYRLHSGCYGRFDVNT